MTVDDIFPLVSYKPQRRRQGFTDDSGRYFDAWLAEAKAEIQRRAQHAGTWVSEQLDHKGDHDGEEDGLGWPLA
jgi:hypothetical protein